jgi:hypothetical protein
MAEWQKKIAKRMPIRSKSSTHQSAILTATRRDTGLLVGSFVELLGNTGVFPANFSCLPAGQNSTRRDSTHFVNEA